MPKFVIDFGSLGRPPAPDGRLDGPAFHRNHEPIWSAIVPFLGTQQGDVLELGSGTGQHAAEFARRAPQLTWWPSDIYAGASRQHRGLAAAGGARQSASRRSASISTMPPGPGPAMAEPIAH